MKHSLQMFVLLALSAGLASGCQQPRAGSTAPADAPACAAVPLGGADLQVGPNSAATARDRQALERLGYTLIARARVSNDPDDYVRAEAAADCLDSRYPGEPAALLLRGHVRHQQHRFPEAETIARALVAKRTFVLDYGLLGDVLMEQGRVSEGAEAYQRMSDLKPFYQSYVRAAHIRWLRGNLEGAIELMRLATQSASPRTPELSAWAWTRLALYELQASRLDEAEAAADRALSYQPEYAAALLARGRVLLSMGRSVDAIAALRRAVHAKPLPEYQWTLADALRQQGLDAQAEQVEQELLSRGATSDPRTLALYLATRGVDAAKALTLAEEELRERADVHTLDAHAWALAANGRIDDAARVMKRALAEGTEDGRLFLHAGVIDGAAGRTAEANRWFARAERLRPMLLPSEAATLTRYVNGNEEERLR